MNKSQRIMTRLFVVAASLAALGANAQTSTSGGYTMGGRGNSYIGLNAGQSDFQVGDGIGVFNKDQGDTSYNLYAGSYFSSMLGLEIGYTDFGSINRAGGRTKADGINLSLVGKWPLGSSFHLLGKLGTTYGRTEVSSAAGTGIVAGTERGFDWSYGLGAEYALTPQWSAVLQYDEHHLKFAGDTKDRISNTTLGVRYSF